MRIWLCVIIILGLSASLFQQSLRVAKLSPQSVDIFSSVAPGGGYYPFMLEPWKPRVASNYLAQHLLAGIDNPNRRPAVWNIAWFIPCCAVVMAISARHSLFMIFGLYAGVTWGYMPVKIGGLLTRIYPWDMPALFFFCCFVLFVQRRWIRPLFLLLPIGILFKETLMIGCVAPLFLLGDRRGRISRTAALVAVCAAAKAAAGLLGGAPLFLSMRAVGWCTPEKENASRFLYNLRILAEPRLAHPLLANGGTFLAGIFAALPRLRDETTRLYLTVLALFTAGLLYYSVIHEFRIWFEAIPISLVLIVEWLRSREGRISS
ncbi:MAG: hypothetical protein JW958_06955 [Candidatus Eisenbacteria bacterium]|nr:hypothetical protein [Candidatus Eisenbacteria bacterium]